jgi:hypothetical protein
MPSWLDSILNFIPIQILAQYFIAVLRREALKSETKIDDLAVNVFEQALKEYEIL